LFGIGSCSNRIPPIQSKRDPERNHEPDVYRELLAIPVTADGSKKSKGYQNEFPNNSHYFPRF
jgi:hypothetical protein